MNLPRLCDDRLSRFAILAIVSTIGATAASAAIAAPRGAENNPIASAPSTNAAELAANNGPIFPDNAPAESCQQNVQLTCPASATFTIERPSDYWKGVKTETLNTPLVAAIDSNGAQRMWCQTPSDFTVEVKGTGADLPRGVTARLNNDRTGIIFSKSISPLSLVPTPPEAALAAFSGTRICGIDCSDTAPKYKDCVASFRKELLKGKVTVNGKSTNVTFTGRVHGDPKPNPETNRLEVSCDVTLRKDFLSVNLRNRPNDVIGTSGGQFNRGYDLKGAALSNACHGLASYTCRPANGSQDTSGLAKCVADRKAACITTFSAPDPCKKRAFENPR